MGPDLSHARFEAQPRRVSRPPDVPHAAGAGDLRRTEKQREGIQTRATPLVRSAARLWPGGISVAVQGLELGAVHLGATSVNWNLVMESRESSRNDQRRCPRCFNVCIEKDGLCDRCRKALRGYCQAPQDAEKYEPHRWLWGREEWRAGVGCPAS